MLFAMQAVLLQHPPLMMQHPQLMSLRTCKQPTRGPCCSAPFCPGLMLVRRLTTISNKRMEGMIHTTVWQELLGLEMRSWVKLMELMHQEMKKMILTSMSLPCMTVYLSKVDPRVMCWLHRHGCMLSAASKLLADFFPTKG